jgi:hypothetical protein
MLDKCANPACSARFLRLGDGKVFVTEVDAIYHSDGSGHRRQRQHFWLCNSCCRTMSVTVEKGKKPQVVPLPESATAARACSETPFLSGGHPKSSELPS